MKKRAGFTLIEIIIAMVVLGIIISIAIPQYQAQFEKMRGAEARNICLQAYAGYQRLVAEGEEISPAKPAGNWTRLGMMDPNLNPNRYFNYSFQGSPFLTWIIAERLTNTSLRIRFRVSDAKFQNTPPY